MRVAALGVAAFAGLILFSFAPHARAQAPTGVIAKDTRQETFQYGRFGTVHMYIPRQIKHVALFADGDGGWNEGIDDMAQLLANEDTLVAGIDSPTYIAALNGAKDHCVYIAADFENLMHAVEKRYQLKTYMVPVISGYSSGASLVYMALAQAPQGTFKGGLSLGFCKDTDLHKPVCRGRGLTTKPSVPPPGAQQQAGAPQLPGTLLQPMRGLSEAWTILQGLTDEACPLPGVSAFTQQIPGAHLVTLPKVGHGFSVGRNWHPQFQSAYRELQKPISVNALPSTVGDLPLVELPASGKDSDRFAVLVTGDGGWAGLDREVAAGLVSAGIPVVALNSLKYFWQARTPSGTAKDLERIIDHYSHQWHRGRVLLVGYSFGANVLPAVVNALGPDVRERVDSISLIGLEPKASFEIRVSGWLGQVTGTQPVLPQLDRLAAARVPVLCIRGQEEKDSLCASLTPAQAHVQLLPGGHHYNGDYAALVRSVLAFRPT